MVNDKEVVDDKGVVDGKEVVDGKGIVDGKGVVEGREEEIIKGDGEIGKGKGGVIDDERGKMVKGGVIDGKGGIGEGK